MMSPLLRTRIFCCVRILNLKHLLAFCLLGVLTATSIVKVKAANPFPASYTSPDKHENETALQLTPKRKNGGYTLELQHQNRSLLSSPKEGFWSIAQNVDDTQAIEWQSSAITTISQRGPWQIFSGELAMGDGNWLLRDACKKENRVFRCIRRMEWKGQETLKDVALSVRWHTHTAFAKAFQPGLLYYGNPAGKKNSLTRSAHMSDKIGEFTRFEEHRFSMPFTSLEWKKGKQYYGAALHSLPSQVPYANRVDQWWSLGVEYQKDTTELQLLSGPIGYNKTHAVAKMLQKESAAYRGATMTVTPGAIIEKTYFIEAYPVSRQGDGFRKPIYSALDIFKPYDASTFPSKDDIVDAKLRFTQDRFFEEDHFVGFNMFEHTFRQQIIMGWAGQSEAPGYFLLPLGVKYNNPKFIQQAQRSLDFLTQSPFGENGFKLKYDVEKRVWQRDDHVSQGQALYMFAKAIEYGRGLESVDTSRWETFFLKAADFHATRILESDWRPISTNEGFHVAPLTLGYQLFGKQKFRDAALKAADHYAERHLSMEEPYWGGTLDARGEDKEGAWAALQAFMAAYDLTKNQKYLDWALHAGDAVLSYTVVWDMPLPPGRLSDHGFKTRGWTSVSPQNQHLDVYGVLTTPWIYRMGQLTQNEDLKRLAEVMYRSCGQLIDPFDSQGEQIQQTNFVQSHVLIKAAGKAAKAHEFRGGYSEEWTVYWITAHFLTAAALFDEMGIAF